ncbi:hypothetical protein ACLDXR_17165 [Acinetobacter baumannii]
MQKNEFLRQFFEIKAGSKLEHTADQYNYIDFDVNFSLKNGDAPVVVFSGEHLIFPIIIEIPKKDHLMMNGVFISFAISGKKYGRLSRVPHFSKLIFNYLKSNQLIEVDNLGNIEIRQEIYP